MSVLEHLEPRSVFRFFEELCAIPHGSRNTKAVSDWCAAFARERGLEYCQDTSNNIIIIKEAAPGYEDAEPVILQGHLDMVCEKEADCGKDMDREGLDLAVEGDCVFARGTTLGGDDGIAVAMALAILDAQDIPHPRLEAVFTADEEIGLLGAAALNVTPLKGRTMVNLDSEEEGVFTVSCAGGCTATCVLPAARAPFAGAPLTVAVEGLTGGHSGAEIHKGRANADMLLGRVLRAISHETALRIQRVSGGLKDNAIPASARAQILVSDAAAARRAAAEMEAALQNEYRAADPALTVRVEAGDGAAEPMDAASTQRILCLLTCAPNGVQAMSAHIPGLVQTSLNLGILTTEGHRVRASFCVRSSVDSQREMLKDRLACLAEQLGGCLEVSGEYTGWQYREASPLRDRMAEVFTEQYGRPPRVEAIHAGLECGIFAGKLPGLDCVSIGPDLLEIHTPRERMSVSSVQRVWAFLLEVLKRSR